MSDDLYGAFLVICAMVAWYCFIRAAMLLPAIWRWMKAEWNGEAASSYYPKRPPPPDPALIAHLQRQANMQRYRNAKERRLHDAR